MTIAVDGCASRTDWSVVERFDGCTLVSCSPYTGRQHQIRVHLEAIGHSVVGDKIQDLRNVDYGQLANDAKDYARQNPGQALLIAAAAGFVIGLLVRGGRR